MRPESAARLLAGVAALIVLLPTAAVSQEVALHGLVGYTEYKDLENLVGVGGRLGTPWLGIELAASYGRSTDTLTGVPCAGLIFPGDPECIEQPLDVTGTIVSLSVGRPIGLIRSRLRLAVVPTIGVAFVDAERVGTLTQRSLTSDRRLLEVALGADVSGRFTSESPLGYSFRVTGGYLVSGGSTCVDCFEAFADDAAEVRGQLGLVYRW